MYAERWESTEVGSRGGLKCPGTRPHVTVAWEGYFGELLQWYKVRTVCLQRHETSPTCTNVTDQRL